MPEIIGPSSYVSSMTAPLDGHISHLRYLTNPKITSKKLQEVFNQTKLEAKENSELISAHSYNGSEAFKQP
ncbi:MAG: hypothetical protein KC422_24630 [Trueperaceae bacterium]|nr:hypothetical protein [Trueperaceae bacterium]